MAAPSYIRSIARDYLDTIAAIGAGMFSSTEELRRLESERSVLHEQLTLALGKVARRIQRHDMPEYAMRLCHD